MKGVLDLIFEQILELLVSDGLRHLLASDELGCALHAVADDWIQSELSQFWISECDSEVLVADLQSKCAIVSV